MISLADLQRRIEAGELSPEAAIAQSHDGISPVSDCVRVCSGSSVSRRWSKIAAARLVPSRTSPVSGDNSPISMLSRVVFPAPFGPTMPTRSPRMIRVEKSRTIGRSA